MTATNMWSNFVGFRYSPPLTKCPVYEFLLLASEDKKKQKPCKFQAGT